MAEFEVFIPAAQGALEKNARLNTHLLEKLELKRQSRHITLFVFLEFFNAWQVNFEVAMSDSFRLKLFLIEGCDDDPRTLIDQRQEAAHDGNDLSNGAHKFKVLNLVFRQKEVAPEQHEIIFLFLSLSSIP